MQLPTQQQFVTDCLSKYWWEPIPADQKWEAAHYPLPECLGGDETVQLWSADHTVQGLLQSVELDHQCFNHRANEKDLLNLQTYYPQYLELFAQLKSQFRTRQGKRNAELKVGVFGQSVEQLSANGKKSAEMGVGIHGRSAEQMSAHGKKNGKKNGKKLAELKRGVCGRSAEQMTADGKIGGKKGAATTNAQRWQCLETQHISNSGGLSTWQKARGIDTKLRVKISTDGNL